MLLYPITLSVNSCLWTGYRPVHVYADCLCHKLYAYTGLPSTGNKKETGPLTKTV